MGRKKSSGGKKYAIRKLLGKFTKQKICRFAIVFFGVQPFRRDSMGLTPGEQATQGQACDRVAYPPVGRRTGDRRRGGCLPCRRFPPNAPCCRVGTLSRAATQRHSNSNSTLSRDGGTFAIHGNERHAGKVGQREGWQISLVQGHSRATRGGAGRGTAEQTAVRKKITSGQQDACGLMRQPLLREAAGREGKGKGTEEGRE